MPRQTFFLFVLAVSLFTYLHGCQGHDLGTFDTDTEDSEERLDPHSFYYDRMKKKMVVEDSPSTLATETTVGPTEIMESLVRGDTESNQSERIFYKRLVNMLLSNMKIQTRDEHQVTGLLRIQATQSQMRILEGFDEAKTSLREIDGILSDVIQMPETDHLAEAVDLAMVILEAICRLWETIVIHKESTVMILATIACLLQLRYVNWRAGVPIFLIVQVIFVMSFFMTWWQLIQEAEIELTAAQMQFSELPIACQPDKMNVWQKFVAMFNGDDCKKYYEAMMTNPKLQVTPVTALSHLISSMIVHPVGNIGRAVSIFVESATGELPYLYAWVVKVLLFVSIGLVILTLPFCLGGARFDIGLGPLFRFGIDCSKRDRAGTEKKREPVEIIIKLPEAITAEAKTEAAKQLTYVEPEKSKDNPEASERKPEEPKGKLEAEKRPEPKGKATEKPCKNSSSESDEDEVPAGFEKGVETLITTSMDQPTITY